MGSDRTKTWLQTKLADRDPQDWAADLVESIPEMADEAEHRALWVSTSGDNTNGDGSLLKPYKSIGTALAAANAGTLTVYAFPGEYTENITWPTTDSVRLCGLGRNGAVTVSATSGTLLKVKPGATPQSTFDAYLENLHLSHTGVDGLYINNANMTVKLMVYCKDVSTNKSGAGTSVVTKHGGENDAIRIYWDNQGEEIEGPCYFTFKDAGDRVRIRGATMGAAIASSTDDIAAELTLMNCELPHGAATSGGHGSQLLASIYSWTRTGTTLAAADTSDFTGSHAETII